MNIPRKNLFGKLDTALFRALESATAYAKLKGHPYVELGHWLWHFWQLPGTDLQLLAAHYKLDAAAVEHELRSASEQQRIDPQGLIDFGHQILALLEKAWVQASLCHGDKKIRSAWLLAACQSHPELRSAMRSICPTLLQVAPALDGADWLDVLRHSVEHDDHAHDQADLSDAIPGEASGALVGDSDRSNPLTRYCTDLTDLARTGKLDPVIGRDHEIRTMVDILLRRRQNNPLLTGEAGVGKTAVVEGLAQAIAERKIPPDLQNVRLLTLDVGALVAGASMRGEFESRLKDLLKQAQSSEQPVILFIDEIHTLVGAGGQAGTGDAANLLKPALARGGLRTIGATTWSEYKKHIEKDPALTRRFQVLQVPEPEPAAAKSMLRALTQTFSKHHGVLIAGEAIDAAVDLSHRYMPARQLPDKAISLLDTACARVAMSLHSEPSALLNARANLHNTQTQLEQCLAEQVRHPEKKSQREQLQIQLEQQQAEVQQQLERWLTEKRLVGELHEHWRLQASDSAIEPNTVSWQAVQQQLQHIQQGQAKVYPEVDAQVVASIVSDWTGIPAGRMLADEKQAILNLQDHLGQRIKGQPEALKTIAQRVQIAKSGLGDPNKPIGVFMLVGPSGVGKTETALALADAIYGGEHNLITLNMSEFQEPHTVSSLKGSPPGYVGYGEGGVLTEAVRRRPYSVILLDEVEKAHPDVHEVFYQVFDKGWMEDGEGRTIDFRNTLILLTSNTGADLIDQLCADEHLQPSAQALADALQPELRKVFPAAFLGRMGIVPYLPLSSAVIAQLVELQLAKVVRRMQDQQGIELHITSAARQQVAGAAGALEIGGRRIAQHIERHILPVLATHWLETLAVEHVGTALRLDWQEQAGYLLEQISPKESIDGPHPVEKNEPNW